ncbi:MAG: TonB-dependent receptor, partial [Bacteroidota bacterium]
LLKVLLSGTQNTFVEDKLNGNYDAIRDYDESYVQGKLALTSVFTHKFNAKNSVRTGFTLSHLTYDLNKQYRDDSSGLMQTFMQTSGSTQTYQSFAQWNHKLSNRLTTNAGAHFLYLALNNTYSLEPRASIKYDVTAKQNIAFGYGLHSQLQPLGAYFAQNKFTGVQPNKDLDLTKAHHFILSHDISLTANTHVKTEVYYQHLFNVPVAADVTNTFSMLNVTDGYTEDGLVNKGAGKNYGVELTIERFTFKNFYYLLSLSLYESKYEAANKQWYDTRFNTNYATTFTAGKEWQLSEKRKGRVLGVNGKLVYVGGFRTSPVNLAESIRKNETVYDESHPFTLQNKDYFRVDVRISIKRNYAKLTSTLSLDIQNATNNQNIGGQRFDKKTGTVKYFYQTGLLPVLAYRIEF